MGKTAILFMLVSLSVVVRADVFNMPSGQTNLAMVSIGNPGNTAEASGGHLCGAVGYTYKLSKFEVTAAQYTQFLNAVARTDTYGLYNTAMWTDGAGCKIQRSGSSGSYTYTVASDMANRPVNFVSWPMAARFTNWLHNRQPTGSQTLGTTEDGAYYLNGANTVNALKTVVRKANARYFIPSESEWYKAAYHKNNGATGDYWDYPTRTDGNYIPSTDYGQSHNSNIDQIVYFATGCRYWLSNAGDFYNASSPYGTFDQGGNVEEWNEALYVSSTARGQRGGHYAAPVGCTKADDWSAWGDVMVGMSYTGFRVAAAADTPGDASGLYCAGAGYSLVGVSTGLAATSATLVAGVAGGDRQVDMTWRSALIGEPVFGDVLTLTGTGSDPFALAMTFADGVPQPYVSWWDGSQWVNAVDGNTGNNAQAAQMGWSGSFAAFQSLYGANLNAYMGAWGVDIGSHQVWAVLNHNSEFAVSSAAPEPSSLLVFGSGLLALCGFARGRK